MAARGEVPGRRGTSHCALGKVLSLPHRPGFGTGNEADGMTPEFWLGWKLLCVMREWVVGTPEACSGSDQEVGQAWARRPDRKEAQSPVPCRMHNWGQVISRW